MGEKSPVTRSKMAPAVERAITVLPDCILPLHSGHSITVPPTRPNSPAQLPRGLGELHVWGDRDAPLSAATTPVPLAHRRPPLYPAGGRLSNRILLAPAGRDLQASAFEDRCQYAQKPRHLRPVLGANQDD